MTGMSYLISSLPCLRLRHTNITLQIAKGIPLVTVAARAGHSRTSTTSDIYSHFIKTSDENAADALDNFFNHKNN